MSLTLHLHIDRDRLRQRLMLAQVVAAPIGLVILGWLLVTELPVARLRVNAGEVGTALGLGVVGLALFGVRLQLILQAFELTVGRRDLWRIHLSSLFYYFFLPAGVGYDLARAAKIGAAVDCPARRLAAMAGTERAVGGVSLLILLLAALPFIDFTEDSPLAWLEAPLRRWGVLAGIAVAAVVGVSATQKSRWPRLASLLSATAASMLAYLVIAGALWFAATSLAIEISPAEVLVALAGTLFFQLIPVNLVGVSLGEVAAVAIYMAYGLERPDAVLLATLAYMQRLGAAAIGGAVEAAHSGRWLSRTGLSSMHHQDADPRG